MWIILRNTLTGQIIFLQNSKASFKMPLFHVLMDMLNRYCSLFCKSLLKCIPIHCPAANHYLSKHIAVHMFSCRAQASIRLRNNPDSRILFSDSLTNGQGIVRTSIIDDQQLKIRECLIQQMPDSFFNPFSGVIGWHYYRNHTNF